MTVTLYENGSPRVLSEANYAAENATRADDCGFGSKAYELFVLDPETKLERVLSWKSFAGFDWAHLLEDAGVEIIYTDGSRHECTFGEVFGLDAVG